MVLSLGFNTKNQLMVQSVVVLLTVLEMALTDCFGLNISVIDPPVLHT